MKLPWRRHDERPATSPPDARPEIAPQELRQLNTVFRAPSWLENLGHAAWLLVGLFGVLLGLVWFLAETYTIGGPVVAATIVATVAMPVVARLARHMPRAIAAVLVLVGLVAVAVLIVVLVIGGITAQHEPIAGHASEGVTKAEGWLKSLGVDKAGADSAGSKVEADVPKIISTLTTGIVNGIRGLTSVVFGLSLAALSLFFLLKDGPSMRRWVDRHLGVPPPVAQTITGGVIKSLRGYFRGVTIIAAFNGVVVGIGALLLGVPLAGTIAVVSFVTAYVPFIGAFVAGAFAVVIALGAKGTGIAIAMLVIVLLANGLLQNILQPFVMGSALDLHPLVVLVATIAAGCLFGTLGLILAAPLLSAAVHITRDLARAKAQAEAQTSGAPESSSAAATS
jgi:predicted PurR-regulated permease PerM